MYLLTEWAKTNGPTIFLLLHFTEFTRVGPIDQSMLNEYETTKGCQHLSIITKTLIQLDGMNTNINREFQNLKY